MSNKNMPTVVWDGDPLQGEARAGLERALPAYLPARRWFGGKARQIAAVRVQEAIPVPYGSAMAQIAFIRVEYSHGNADTYVLPLAISTGQPAERIAAELPHTVIARVSAGAGQPAGILHDATADRDFNRALLEIIADNRRLQGAAGELAGSTTQAFARLRGTDAAPPEPSIMRAEQSNTSVAYGDRMILKIFRRAESGANPDLEIGRFLTERRAFGNIPPVAGAIEYSRAGGEPATLALLMGFVPNRGDAWDYTLDTLDGYFERVAASGASAPEEPPLSTDTLLHLASQDMPRQARDLIGEYLESARLLGRRSAEMHLALAGDTPDPAFAPEPFADQDRQSLYQALRDQASRGMRALRDGLEGLPEAARADARQILELEAQSLDRFKTLVEQPIDALRTRIHGDYHLGQVLYTGEDFFIIDFEGEPARPLSERRAKRSPLQDVAGMLRSFHYAPYAALLGPRPSAQARASSFAALEPWARFWHRWVSVAFVDAYLATAAGAAFLPRARDQLRMLLDVYLLEKAIYELNYELNNRPTWTPIPLQGILQLLETSD